MHAVMGVRLPVPSWQSVYLALAMLQQSGLHDCVLRPRGCCEENPLSPVLSRRCHHRAYEMEKGFVRDTPLTYVVALSGNTAKDVTQR